MQVTATGVNFSLDELGLTAEQAQNQKLALQAILKNFATQNNRMMGIEKIGDIKARGINLPQGTITKIYRVNILLTPNDGDVDPMQLQFGKQPENLQQEPAQTQQEPSLVG